MLTKREQATAVVNFRIHLFTFMAVMGLLIIINLLNSPDVIWFIWPLLGWGLGLVLHGLKVFYWSDKPSLKERLIEKEMNK